MQDAGLILVEGTPGTGKSTVSQLVARRLRVQPRSVPRAVDWWQEERPGSPVRLFFDGARHGSRSDYIDEADRRWRTFVEELRAAERIAVMDGAVLQNHVRSMLLHEAGRSAIDDLIGRIEAAIASLNPIWVHLTPHDVERSLDAVIRLRCPRLRTLWVDAHDRFPYARRPGGEGFSGLVRFWEEFDAIADRVCESLSIVKSKFEPTSAGSQPQEEAVLQFLQLPRPPEPPSDAELWRFTGVYEEQDCVDAGSMIVEVQGGCLVARFGDVTFDVLKGPFGCSREIRLVPISGHRFHVEAWPHEVEFGDFEDARPQRLSIHATAESWAPERVSYVRR